MATLGVIFLLLAMAGGTFVVTHVPIDWYHYKPTSWVIDDLTATNRIPNMQAWKELGRRMADGELLPAQKDHLADQCIATLPLTVSSNDPAWAELLSQDATHTLGETQRQKLIAWALQCQLVSSIPVSANAPLDWLATQLLADRLTAAQREAFLSNLTSWKLEAREQIAKDASLPYSITYEGHGPEHKLWFHYDRGPIEIDGQTVVKHAGSGSGSPLTGSGSTSHSYPTKDLKLAAGQHTIRGIIRLRIFAGDGLNSDIYDENKAPALWDKTTTYQAAFSVLPVGTPDEIELKNDAALAQSMPTAFNAREAKASSNAKGMDVTIYYTKPSENFAFDVFALIDGAEHRIGSFSSNAGHDGGWSLSGGDFDATKLATINLILRSNEEVARNTVDMKRIWKGEILLKHVPVKLGR